MVEFGDKKGFKFHRSLVVMLLEFLRLLLPVALVVALIHCAATPEIIRQVLPGLSPITVYRLICGMLLLEILRRYFDELYIFGHSRVIHYKGRLSFRTRKTSICYADIREVSVQQTLLGRLLNYGTLVLGTAANDMVQMELRDLSHPHKLADLAAKLVGPSSIQRHAPLPHFHGALPRTDD